MKSRLVCVDTETTGLDVKDGHRIIEIGCVEIINRKITEKSFQVYLNPKREIDVMASKVHGLTASFLMDKPEFHQIAAEFLAFIADSTLVIHNAVFDLSFLEAELKYMQVDYNLQASHPVIDTLLLARERHRGQKNNLDALCKRYNIDNSNRQLHGAFKDALLLARLYLAMTGGQGQLFQETEKKPSVGTLSQQMNYPPLTRNDGKNVAVIRANSTELAAHEAFLASLLPS